MGRYPAESLESKLVWMRERQRRRQEKESKFLLVRSSVESRALAEEAEVQLQPSAELPQMLRVRQVAKALGVSLPSVYRWFRDRSVIVQGRRKSMMLIPRRALDEWIREHTAR